MRRDRITQAASEIREALNAAQIRELLRLVRTGQPAEGENRTERILSAYHEFMRYYNQFGDQEKNLVASLGLAPLLDTTFWSALVDGGPTLDRKLLSEIEIAAYNVIFVMPKLSEILARETDKGQFLVADGRGRERQISSLRVLLAEKDRSLTDPNIVIALIRSMDKLYKALATLHGEKSVGLAIGSVDSGSAKSFDFFGASAIMEEIGSLLLNVWDRVKYCPEENLRYQIELAMVAVGFGVRVRRAQNIVDGEEAQRASRLVAKSIEMIFRCGAYTEEMDSARESRASKILTPKGRAMEFRQSGTELEVIADNSRSSPEQGWQNGHSVQGNGPSVSGILSSFKEGLELEDAVEA